jgi:hypothetical protein
VFGNNESSMVSTALSRTVGIFVHDGSQQVTIMVLPYASNNKGCAQFDLDLSHGQVELNASFPNDVAKPLTHDCVAGALCAYHPCN